MSIKHEDLRKILAKKKIGTTITKDNGVFHYGSKGEKMELGYDLEYIQLSKLRNGKTITYTTPLTKELLNLPISDQITTLIDKFNQYHD
jgi:hypothetical protein